MYYLKTAFPGPSAVPSQPTRVVWFSLWLHLLCMCGRIIKKPQNTT